MPDFVGVKVALINGDQLITTQRDNKPGLQWPGNWELPGGGREGGETPVECAIREIKEELGIHITEKSFIWEKVYPAVSDPSKEAHFFVATISSEEISKIRLGDEGQAWKVMNMDDFLNDSSVVEHQKRRLQDFLSSRKPAG